MSGNVDYLADLPDGTNALVETESNSGLHNRLSAYKNQYEIVTRELKTKKYILMNGDTETLYIDFENHNIRVLNNEFLPLPLKDFLRDTDENNYSKSSQDIEALRDYLASRVLSLSRTNAKAILNSVGFSQSSKIEERLKLTIACRGLSFQDNIWLKKEDEEIKFSDINLRENKLANKSYEIAILGKTISATVEELRSDLTSLGMFPKYWNRKNNRVYLYKTDTTSDFRYTIAEVRVSNYLQKMKVNSVKYWLEEMPDGKKFAVSECFCTNERSFVSALDVMDHFTRIGKDYHKYINEYWLKDFSNMVVIDYVFANIDRHIENYGFMVDNNKNQIISMAPLYDHNQALVVDAQGIDIDILDYEPTGQMFVTAAEEYYKTSDVIFPETELPDKCLKRLNRLKQIDRVNDFSAIKSVGTSHLSITPKHVIEDKAPKM